MPRMYAIKRRESNKEELNIRLNIASIPEAIMIIPSLMFSSLSKFSIQWNYMEFQLGFLCKRNLNLGK